MRSRHNIQAPVKFVIFAAWLPDNERTALLSRLLRRRRAPQGSVNGVADAPFEGATALAPMTRTLPRLSSGPGGAYWRAACRWTASRLGTDGLCACVRTAPLCPALHRPLLFAASSPEVLHSVRGTSTTRHHRSGQRSGRPGSGYGILDDGEWLSSRWHVYDGPGGSWTRARRRRGTGACCDDPR